MIKGNIPVMDVSNAQEVSDPDRSMQRWFLPDTRQLVTYHVNTDAVLAENLAYRVGKQLRIKVLPCKQCFVLDGDTVQYGAVSTWPIKKNERYISLQRHLTQRNLYHDFIHKFCTSTTIDKLNMVQSHYQEYFNIDARPYLRDILQMDALMGNARRDLSDVGIVVHLDTRAVRFPHIFGFDHSYMADELRQNRRLGPDGMVHLTHHIFHEPPIKTWETAMEMFEMKSPYRVMNMASLAFPGEAHARHFRATAERMGIHCVDKVFLTRKPFPSWEASHVPAPQT